MRMRMMEMRMEGGRAREYLPLCQFELSGVVSARGITMDVRGDAP